MTNLEFYINEIKKQYTYYTAYSQGTNSLEDFSAAINHISRQYGQNLHGCEDVLDWLCKEYKEPILRDNEQEYLSNFIKPFKNRVQYICKHSLGDFEEIGIIYDKDLVLTLPDFKAKTKFNGMELDYPYELEELGL